jgi:hypothetical protein
MMAKKGQAAMEFLMTYGWAILAAVIVIGVLAYFGVFTPSTYVPNTCVISAPFGCNAGSVNISAVIIEIMNGGGEGFNITSLTIGLCAPVTNIGNVASDSLTKVVVNCSTGNVNSKYKGEITLRYTKSGSSLEQSSSGQIVNKILAA